MDQNTMVHCKLCHTMHPSTQFTLFPDTCDFCALASTEAQNDPHIVQHEVIHADSWYEQHLQALTGEKLERVLLHLQSVTDLRLKHPFFIRGFSEAGASREISVNPKDYSQALFRIETEPQDEEGITYKKIEFGYTLNNDFRRIGCLHYLRITSEGFVAEAGFGSELARDYFLHHLFGRVLSPDQQERIRFVQEEVFQYLRNHPIAQEQMHAFSRSRGWPDGLAEVARLAYFDNRITPLEAFAEHKDISNEEMYLAGWYDLSFSLSGLPSYSVRDSKVIRIPYFQDGAIEVWRTRNLRPAKATAHKYTSWPLDRSIERTFHVEEKLYYGWELAKARGQTIVLTEGEFKCLVAKDASGILTVGIPGITEVDATIITALVQANASNYIVILDRDPRGKGYMRVDGITDSERAAYRIALELQRAGAKNVRIGHIPDVRNGQKVGIDDLILDQGVEAYLQVIEEAVSPSLYAHDIGLNETFFTLMQARQQIKKALEHYEHSVRRGGQRVDEEIYEEAHHLHEDLEHLYADFLLERFRGAYRIDQPSRAHTVLFRTAVIDGAEKKIVMSRAGDGFALDRFQNDIIFFQYFPADTPRELLWIGRNDLMFPLSMEEMIQFFHTGENPSPLFSSLLEQGVSVLGKNPKDGHLFAWESIEDLAVTLLVGYLSRDFPSDEFTLLPSLALYVDRGTHWEEHVCIPLAIFKTSSGEAVALVSLMIWNERDEIPNAIMLDNRLLLFTTSFLRQRGTLHDEAKLRMVIETLYPYWFKRKYAETVETMDGFGISEATVEAHQLLALTPVDYQELIDHFAFRRLLNQATHSGLFSWDEHKRIVPRFQGKTVLLPVFERNGMMVSLRVLPLIIEDHCPPASDPSHKLIRPINGGDRHLLKALDPARQLYMQEQLRAVKGKCLLVTLHELDGLILRSQERNVVSLNHAFEFHPDIIEKIASAAPASLCIVISGQTPSSRYDDFAFDGIAGFLKDLYDAQETMNATLADGSAPIVFSLTVLPFPLTHLATHEGLSKEAVEAIIASALPVQTYLQTYKFNAMTHAIVQRFLNVHKRLLDYLEIQALPDLLDGKPIEWWVKENRRLYAAIDQYVQKKHQVALPSLSSYFQKKLHLEDPLDIDELVRLRREEGKLFLHKPLFSSEKHVTLAVSEEFRQLFHRVIEERPSVALQTIQNSLPLSGPIAPSGQKRASFSSTIVSGETPTQPNAKGDLFAYHQRSPDRFSRPEVVQESNSEGVFTLTVRLHISHEPFELIGIGTATRKRDAEAIACEQILHQMDALQQQHPSETKKVLVDNPKGTVYEMLQRADPSFPRPIINLKQVYDGFEVSVVLKHQGNEYSSKGHGTTKKEAEKEAFSIILDTLEGRRNWAGLLREEREKIEQALHMAAGDKNYVGHTHKIAQMLQVSPPQFSTRFSLAEEGTAYRTYASILLTPDFTVEAEANSLFPDVSRQQAALNLLSRLSNIISDSPPESTNG